MYIRNYSFLYDLALIIQTIKVVFDKNSATGVRKDTSFDDYVKYYGCNIVNINENVAMIERVIKR